MDGKFESRSIELTNDLLDENIIRCEEDLLNVREINHDGLIYPLLILVFAYYMYSSIHVQAQDWSQGFELPQGARIVQFDDAGTPDLIANEALRLHKAGFAEQVDYLIGNLIINREGDIPEFLQYLSTDTNQQLQISPFVPIINNSSEIDATYKFIAIAQLYLRAFEVNLDVDIDSITSGEDIEISDSNFNLLVNNPQYPIVYYDGSLSYEEFVQQIEGQGIRLVIHNDLDGFPYGVYNRPKGFMVLQINAFNSFIHEFIHLEDKMQYGDFSGTLALIEIPASVEDAQFRRSIGDYLNENGYHPSLPALNLLLDIDLHSNLELISDPDASIFDYIRNLTDRFRVDEEALEAAEKHYDDFLLSKLQEVDFLENLDFMEKFTLSYYIQIVSRNYHWVIDEAFVCQLQNRDGESRYFKIIELAEGVYRLDFVEEIES